MKINYYLRKMYKNSKLSSDSSFHEYLIYKIKLNNNQFILKFDNFLFGQRNMYPQLYHWLLSFFKSDRIYFWNLILKIFLWFIQGFMFFYLLNVADLILDIIFQKRVPYVAYLFSFLIHSILNQTMQRISIYHLGFWEL